MAKVISRDNINRANNRIITREITNINRDYRNVSMKCQTTFRASNIVVSREKIAGAASSALRNATRGMFVKK